jgi:hypothetical protein
VTVVLDGDAEDCDCLNLTDRTALGKKVASGHNELTNQVGKPAGCVEILLSVREEQRYEEISEASNGC